MTRKTFSTVAICAALFSTPVLAQDLAPLSDGLRADAAPSTTTFSSQGRGGPAIGFTLRGGVATQPEFFGAESNEAGADIGFGLNYLRLGRLSFGDPDPLFVPEGFGVTGSLRVVGEREADDDPILAGTDDVDTALELGVGLRYATRGYQVFGAVRYGVIGHESFVGELGADVFARPTDRLTLRAGPRALFGSDDYADTYFGVTPAEAAAGPLTSFDPDGGLISTGVEVGAGYRITDAWGLDAAIRYERLRDDAADSPISLDDEQVTARIGITRRFNFGF